MLNKITGSEVKNFCIEREEGGKHQMAKNKPSGTDSNKFEIQIGKIRNR